MPTARRLYIRWPNGTATRSSSPTAISVEGRVKHSTPRISTLACRSAMPRIVVLGSATMARETRPLRTNPSSSSRNATRTSNEQNAGELKSRIRNGRVVAGWFDMSGIAQPVEARTSRGIDQNVDDIGLAGLDRLDAAFEGGEEISCFRNGTFGGYAIIARQAGQVDRRIVDALA